jgi:GTPase SAR1 family protein
MGGQVKMGTKKKLGQGCKIVMLGDAAVGKSSIAERLTKEIYSENYNITIGGAFLQKDVQLKSGKVLKVHL